MVNDHNDRNHDKKWLDESVGELRMSSLPKGKRLCVDRGHTRRLEI